MDTQSPSANLSSPATQTSANLKKKKSGTGKKVPGSNFKEQEKKLEGQLFLMQKKRAEERVKETAEKSGFPYIDLLSTPVDASALYTLPEKVARNTQTIIIYKKGRGIKIASVNPKGPDAQKLIQEYKTKGFEVTVFMISTQGLEKAWRMYALRSKATPSELGILRTSEEHIKALGERINTLKDLQEKIRTLSLSRVIELVFAGALKLRSSDVHFEPEEKSIRLRYRIDGVLQDIATFDKKDYPSILSRIKIMSGLKLNVHKQAQDGRFTIRQEGIDVEVRVSVLPGAYGEHIVLRLLDPRTIKQALEDLGMRDDTLVIVKRELQKTVGAIITTGPTGSGKTTTLYAFIRKVNNPHIKIITIENPIEYHIQGISQTQVEPEKGYTFATGLRAIVRQDPDVILVGEVRDKETAEIAMQAALTGHLVFTTLHTNDAAGTIPRLIDLGVKPATIAPAINAAMAQRLVRKLCEKCKEQTPISTEQIEKLAPILTSIQKKNKSIPIPTVTRETLLSSARACDACNMTGYKGRLGIYEIFLIDNDMERLILRSPAIVEIQDLAEKKGMITMREDGYLKVLQGITTFEEIKRVVNE